MTTSPAVLTSIEGDGPMMTLDLSKVPASAIAALVMAATVIKMDWDNLDLIAVVGSAAPDDMDRLSDSLELLNEFYQETIPSRETIVNCGYGSACDHLGYLVVRNDAPTFVPAQELTDAEKVATRRWLQHYTKRAKESAESFASRLAQFEQESA